MIPVLYERNEKQFRDYGLGEVPFTKAEVTRERNGEYLFYGEIHPDSPNANELIEQRLIKSDAGVRTKNQTFIIDRVVKVSKDVVQVYAQHISSLTTKMSFKPLTTGKGTAEIALRTLMANSVGGTEFDVWSDIQLDKEFTFDITKHQSVRQAMGGVQGSILDLYGGEYEFDNTLIRLHKQMGRDTPTTIEYGRNLTNAKVDKQIQNTTTKILPYAIYYDEEGNPHTLWLDELTIDGKHVDNWEYQRIEPIDFSYHFEQEEEPTQERLRTLANQYVESNNIGVPKTNIELSYIDLSRTLDYKDYATMEEVELCDIVPVYYYDLGLWDSDAKVSKVVFDVLIDSNQSVSIGAIGSRLTGGVTQEIADLERRTESQLDAIKDQTLPYLVNAVGNRIWYTTPDENMEHKVGDTWFEKNGQYYRLYVWNGEMWELILDTEDTEQFIRVVEETEANMKLLKDEILVSQEEADRALADFQTRLDQFELDLANIDFGNLDLGDLNFAEFLLNDLEFMTSFIDELDIDQAIQDAGFGQALNDIRSKLEHTSDTLETTIELLGNDAHTAYNKNRATVTEGSIPYGEDGLVVGHNGDGFLIGRDYVVSFDATCIILPNGRIELVMQMPVIGPISVAFQPTNGLPEFTVESAITEARTMLERVFNGTYQVIFTGDWYKTTTETRVIEGDEIIEKNIAFKEIADGNLLAQYEGIVDGAEYVLDGGVG